MTMPNPDGTVPKPDDKEDTPAQEDASTPTPDEQEPLQTGPDDADAVKEETVEEEPAPDGEEAADEEGDETEDLTDDDLEAIAEVYGDRIIASKKLGDRIAKSVGDEVKRQVTEQTRSREQASQVDELVARGRNAAQGLYEYVDTAQKELAKANKGEDFSSDGLDKEKFVAHMRDFGSSIAADVARNFDQAVEAAWDEVFSEVLPAVAEEQAGEAVTLVETYQRMRADPRQAPQAESYFFKGMLKFVAERGVDYGRKDAIEKMGKAKPLRDKITNRNAAAAAKAKIESQKNPPRTPESKPTSIASAFSDEAYEKAKEAGDTELAQKIVNEQARRMVAGQQ